MNALQVNLTLSKTYFLPGEVVQVSVQICNDAESTGPDAQQGASSQVIHIKELSFLAYGSERTDPSYIHRLHRSDVPAEASDTKKQVRSIFSTEPAVLVSEKVLAPHAVQQFQLRFRLPAVLPPSYRGTAVRFLYLIQVKAVYEVHRGGLEAVTYETTASTTLIVWPGTAASPASAAGPSGAPPERRTTSSLEFTNGGSAAPNAPTAPGALPRDASYSGASAGPDSGAGTMGGAVGPGGDSYWRSRSPPNGHAASPSSSQPPHSASFSAPSNSGAAANGAAASGGQGGGRGEAGDDGDMVMCDYALGRKCRIRWREVRSGEPGLGSFSGGGPQGEPPRLGDPLDSSASSGVWAPGAGAPHRGFVPFGVNRPYSPPFSLNTLAHALDHDTDSDPEEGADGGKGGSPSGGRQPGSQGGASVSASQQAAHVQRQLSSGAPGSTSGGLGPFGRQPSRKGSLFGKTYSLTVGEHTLLRLLLQAPLEVPLQPGATFGGVLDFRPPSPSGAGGGGGPVACYNVAVMLESEELVAPECRLQGKRDGSGIPAGAPYAIRRLHGEHHELTCDAALTCFTFSLPASATPSFRTPMVALRWVLRFELTVGPRIAFAALDKRARSPRPLLEQLDWCLPLVVRPPVAMQR